VSAGGARRCAVRVHDPRSSAIRASKRRGRFFRCAAAAGLARSENRRRHECVDVFVLCGAIEIGPTRRRAHPPGQSRRTPFVKRKRDTAKTLSVIPPRASRFSAPRIGVSRWGAAIAQPASVPPRKRKDEWRGPGATCSRGEGRCRAGWARGCSEQARRTSPGKVGRGRRHSPP